MFFTQPPTGPQQPFAGYDPLATQFLTGGQMGYMPDAQFMTPSQYGAFRTLPSQNFVTPIQQRQSLLQSYLIANQGSLPVNLPFNMHQNFFNVYNPAVNQLRYQAMAQRRVSDAGTAFMGGLADVGVSAGVGIAAGTLFGGPVGLAASLLAAPVVSKYTVDRIGKGRRIQEMSLPKIVTGPDLSASFGQGFSLSASTSIDDSIRKTAAKDLVFREEDYRKIMDVGIKAGLFDYSTSAEQYKRTIKQLRDNFKTMMSLFEVADFNELGKHLQRLQTMGATMGQAQGVANYERMFSRITGMSHDNLVSTYGQQGALIYSQMGMTNYQGSLANMANAANITLMQRLGLLNPAEVARRGGVSGMAQDLTQQGATVQKRLENFYLPALAGKDFKTLDTDKIQKMMSGELSFAEVTNQSAGRIRNASDLSKYESNRANLNQQLNDQLGPAGMQLLQYRQAQSISKMSGVDLVSAYRLMGFDPEVAKQQAEMMQSPEYVRGLQKQYEQQAIERRKNEFEERQNKRRLLSRIAIGYREWQADVGSDLWGGLSRRMAANKDYKEQLKLGVLSTNTYGAGAGFEGISNSEQKQMILDAIKKGGLTVVKEGTDYDSMLTTGENILLHGASRRERVEELKGAQKVISFENVTKEEREKSLSAANKILEDMGVKTKLTSNDLYKLSKKITKSKQLDKNELADTIALQKGISKEAALKILEDESASKAIYSSIAKNKDLVETLKDDLSERGLKGRAKTYEELADRAKKLDDLVGELTDQGWFGLNDEEDTMTLKTAMKKNVKSIDVYSEIVQKVAKGEYGIDDDETYVKKLTKMGLSEEQAESMLKAAKDKAKDIGGNEKDLKEFVSMTSKAKQETIAVDASARALDAENVLQSAFKKAGYAGDLSTLLTDKDAIKKVLASGNISAKEKQVLQTALASKGTGKEDILADVVSNNYNLLSSEAKKTRYDLAPANDVEKKQAVVLEGLEQVLSELNTTMKEVARVTSESIKIQSKGKLR